MVRPKRSIEWILLAKQDLKTILSFYKRRSQQGYELVKDAILFNLNKAARDPLIFIVDNLKYPKDFNIGLSQSITQEFHTKFLRTRSPCFA